MIPVLQSRWKLKGRTLTYYGLRAAPNTNRRTLHLGRRTAAVFGAGLCAAGIDRGAPFRL